MTKPISQYTPTDTPPGQFDAEVLAVTDDGQISVKIKRGKLGGLYKSRKQFTFAKAEAIGFDEAQAGDEFRIRVTRTGDSQTIQGTAIKRIKGKSIAPAAETGATVEATDLPDADTPQVKKPGDGAVPPASPLGNFTADFWRGADAALRNINLNDKPTLAVSPSVAPQPTPKPLPHPGGAQRSKHPARTMRTRYCKRSFG